MRVSGEWLECADGGIRPVVRAEVLGGDGIWREVEFLVDTGADRTVLSGEVFQMSGLSRIESDRLIGGIGGLVESTLVQTQVRLIQDDGQQVLLRGEFAACTQIDAIDMSILGREILDMFALIIDRRANVVAILGGRHHYAIRSPRH